jgi:hypothetical protein
MPARGLTDENIPTLRRHLETFKGKPGDNPALFQLYMWNRDEFGSDPTGDAFAACLTFIADNTPDRVTRLQNLTDFSKAHFARLPAAAQERTKPLVDKYWQEWWDYIREDADTESDKDPYDPSIEELQELFHETKKLNEPRSAPEPSTAAKSGFMSRLLGKK